MKFWWLAAILAITPFTASCGLTGDSSREDAGEAVALLQQRRIAEARLAINRAIEERDDEPGYYLIRARIEMTAGAIENAYLAFSDALALDATNREALEGVSQVGLQVGRLDESLRATDILLTLDPNDVNALLVRGLVEFVRKRYSEALVYADRILAVNPDNEGGVILHVRSKFLMDDIAEAKARLAEFEDDNGTTAGSARTRLEIARYQGDAEAIQIAFDDLATAMPDDIGIRIDEANFLFKRGQTAEGMTKVAEVLSDDAVTDVQASQILELIEEYSVEEELAGRRIALLQAAPAAIRIEAAHLFIDSGLFEDARALLDGLQEADAAAMQARLALAQGNDAEALDIANAVLDRDADNCMALAVSAEVALDTQQVEKAVRLGQRAAAQCPRLREGWVVTGRAFAAKDDMANARRVFRDGVNAMPQNTPMAVDYTNWLLQQDANREAIAIARKLTRSAPALSSGWRLYERLCRTAGSSCTKAAAEGLAQAERTYGVDLQPGERPPNGLFGRFVRR